MNKFGKEKIATLLACATVLGGKAPCSQTVEAAGRSVESSSKGFVNWVKNHKWPVIGGASAFVTAAIVSAVLGVKYLGKKDQKNPDEQENKINGENSKQGKEKEKEKEKNTTEADKKECFSCKIIDIVFKDETEKNEVLGNFGKLRVKVPEWLNNLDKRRKELTLSTKEKSTFNPFNFFAKKNEEDVSEKEVSEVLSLLDDILHDRKKLQSVARAKDEGVFLRLDDCHFLCKFKDDRYIVEFYRGDYKINLWFKKAVTQN